DCAAVSARRPRDIPGIGEAVLEAAERAGVGVAVATLVPELRPVYLSRRALEILGRSREEVDTTDLLALVTPESRAIVEERIAGRAGDEALESPFEVTVVH